MSIRSKTSDEARTLPYLNHFAIKKLFCLLYGRLIIWALDDLGRLLNVAVLVEDEDPIRPHTFAPPCLNLRVAQEGTFKRRVSHEDAQKNGVLNRF
jgi:hypothetical protein